MMIDLSADDIRVLREALDRYLSDFRREVAGTENPQFRRDLQRQQNQLERVLAQLQRMAAPASPAGAAER